MPLADEKAPPAGADGAFGEADRDATIAAGSSASRLGTQGLGQFAAMTVPVRASSVSRTTPPSFTASAVTIVPLWTMLPTAA